jgi:transcription initiation factor IIE alpha subunit
MLLTRRVVAAARRLRMTSTRIAAELGMAVSTVGAVLRRLGLHPLVASRAASSTPSLMRWRRRANGTASSYR